MDLPPHRNRLARLRADRVPVGLHDGVAISIPVRRRRRLRRSERVHGDLRSRRPAGSGFTASSACCSCSSGSTRSWNPYDTFSTLAALVGLFLLFKGIFDIMRRVHHEGRVRALVAPARARPGRDPARLLGRRGLPREGDPARDLRRDHRARPRDQRDLRRVQAEGPATPARSSPDCCDVRAVRRV